VEGTHGQLRARLTDGLGGDNADSFTLAGYEATGGYQALRKALSMGPAAVADEVKTATLLGRGGAGFPAGVKWGLAPENVWPRYLVVNGDESEPGTYKDRLLMERDPHQLIEGVLLACYAIGCGQAFLYVRGEMPLAQERIAAALNDAYAAGYVGKNILGSDFSVDVILSWGAGAYIVGEETALIESLEGNRGMPRLKPPFFPAAKGLYMPDGMATFQSGGKTLVVMANEGDFREDDADRSAASSVSSTLYPANSVLGNLRVSNTDSSANNLFAAGARSFSIRETDGTIVYDSGNILDVEANKLGLYDDARSRDKGVEPEGVELMEIDGKTFAFIGLERTTKGAVAVFDITDPANASFVKMLTLDAGASGFLQRPEGLKGFAMDGTFYLAVASEGADGLNPGTALFSLAPVPEPSTYALMLAGLLGVASIARRRRG
jgi:hypothetical protein